LPGINAALTPSLCIVRIACHSRAHPVEPFAMLSYGEASSYSTTITALRCPGCVRPSRTRQRNCRSPQSGPNQTVVLCIVLGQKFPVVYSRLRVRPFPRIPTNSFSRAEELPPMLFRNLCGALRSVFSRALSAAKPLSARLDAAPRRKSLALQQMSFGPKTQRLPLRDDRENEARPRVNHRRRSDIR